MSDETSPWPPSNGLCTPTVPRNSAILPLSASIRVNAPASLVFENVMNVKDYPKWNTFVPRVQILKQPSNIDDPNDESRLYNGTAFNFYAVMDSSKPDKATETGLIISDVSTPEKPSEYIHEQTRTQDPSYTADLSKVYRVSWKSHGGFASRGLKSERFHEIIVLGEKECEVRTWEVMGGLLAHTVKWLYQKTLQDKFRLWCEELKKYSEQEAAGGAGT